VKLGYTEFSFGYAFTENLIRWAPVNPTGAPVFPNLLQEAELGYDMHLNLPGCPLFFQYKLPELMVKSTAAEIAVHRIPGIQIPFFRMPLIRRDLSRQHERLMELERRFPGTVLYAAPQLRDVVTFNAAYNAAQVHLYSAFFSPVDIGPLPDDKSHIVAYRAGLASAWLCSEPREIPVQTFDDLENRLHDLFGRDRFRTLENASVHMRSEVLALASRDMQASESVIRQRIHDRRTARPGPAAMSPETERVIEDILVTREIARVDLGLDWLVVQPST
jgi:hypothetical protein